MHSITKNTSIPDVQQTCATITKHNDRLGVCIDFDKLLTYYSYSMIVGRKVRTELQRYLRLGVDNKASDVDFLRVLGKMGVREGLLTTATGNISLSAESMQNAIDTGLYNSEAVTVMTSLMKMSNYEYTENALRKLTAYEPVNIPTFDGHRMIIVHPIWVPQNTGRLAMQKPAIQNLAKSIKDILTVPKGWVLYECDSSQIEPRVIYSAFIPDPQIKALINLYNDAYYGVLHYVQMPKENIASGTLNFTANEITPELVDLRAAFKRLGNGVMYGKQSNPGNDPLVAAYISRIGGHPMRLKWQERMEEAVDRGQTVFRTYFGTPIDISVGEGREKYMASANGLRNHDVRCAINNPIQGTAADLMRYSVQVADHRLSRECPNSVILTYTHDSGKFAIHEDEYHKAMPFIKDIVAYQVDNWIPIYSEGEEGRHQGVLFPDVY